MFDMMNIVEQGEKVSGLTWKHLLTLRSNVKTNRGSKCDELNASKSQAQKRDVFF